MDNFDSGTDRDSRILITGGAGFIGSHLTQRLLATKKDTEITLLDNFSVGTMKNLSSLEIKNNNTLNIITGDIRDRKLIDRIMPKTDTVYHMAAVVGVDRVIRMPEETWDIEYNGTKTVLESAASNKVSRFFLASTSECYGNYDPAMLPMKESHDITPNTNYGRAKFGCEKMCAEYTRQKQISCVTVRYFNIYGNNQSFNGYVIPNFMTQAMKGDPLKIYGHGNQFRDMTYVRDAIDATIRLAESDLEDTYNIGSGDKTTINNLAETVLKITDSPSDIIHAEVRRPQDTESKLADNTKIKEAIGWTPTTRLDEGLKKTIPYYKRCLDERCSDRLAP